MDSVFGSLLVGLMVAAFGVVGLLLAFGAADSEMLVFGLGLVVFAVGFDFGLFRRLSGKSGAAAGTARETTHV